MPLPLCDTESLLVSLSGRKASPDSTSLLNPEIQGKVFLVGEEVPELPLDVLVHDGQNASDVLSDSLAAM